MMGATGHYVHRCKLDGLSEEYNNSYDIDRKIRVRLNRDITDGGSALPLLKKKAYAGNIQLIRIKGTVSGATQLTLKGYADADGTELLLPPSSGIIESGVSGSDGSVVFKVDIFHASNTDDLYLFCKTNSGTFTVSEIQVAWYE